MATDIERLVVQLEANMRGYERSMQRAVGQTNQTARRMESRFDRANQSISRSFQTMGRIGVQSLAAIGVAVGGAQLAQLTAGALQSAEAIADTADRVGFAVEQLQELRFAADQNGSSARTLDMALQRFSRRVGEAANGTGELRQSLIETGIQLRNSDGTMRTSYELLLDYADAIQAAESDQRALGLAFKAFDSEGASLVTLMRQGREGVIEFGQAARESGVVLDEGLVRNGAEANRVIRAMRQEISGEFNAAVLENADSLQKLAGALGDVASAAINATGALIDMFTDPEGSAAIREDIERLEERLRTLRAGGGRVEQIADLEDRLTDLRGQLSLALDFEEFRAWWESQEGQAPGTGGAGGSGSAGGGASGAPAGPNFGAVNMNGEVIASANARLKPATGLGGMGSNPEADKAKELGLMQADEYAREMERNQDKFSREFAYTFAGGFRAAFEGDLADFAAQRLRDALAERLFSLFEGLGRTLFNAINGEGGGGVLATIGKAAFGGGKAAGGPVRAGMAYRVGERGPETIIPAQNGMVLPNAAMAPMRGQGGGVTVVNQFHLHAEGAVMTDELLREMDAKAETAGRTAVAVSRNDLASIRKRNSRRLG